jgi:hypothetical protein
MMTPNAKLEFQKIEYPEYTKEMTAIDPPEPNDNSMNKLTEYLTNRIKEVTENNIKLKNAMLYVSNEELFNLAVAELSKFSSRTERNKFDHTILDSLNHITSLVFKITNKDNLYDIADINEHLLFVYKFVLKSHNDRSTLINNVEVLNSFVKRIIEIAEINKTKSETKVDTPEF